MPLYKSKETGNLIHAIDMVKTDYGYVSEEFYREFYLDDDISDIEFYDLIEAIHSDDIIETFEFCVLAEQKRDRLEKKLKINITGKLYEEYIETRARVNGIISTLMSLELYRDYLNWKNNVIINRKEGE